MTGELLRQSHVATGFDAGKLLLAAENERLKVENAKLRAVLEAARQFYEHHQRGQPGTPGTLYPMTYGVLDQWHADWDYRLKTFGIGLALLEGDEQ